MMLAERFSVPVISEQLSTRTLQAAAVRSTVTRAAVIVLNASGQIAPLSGTAQAWLVERVSICHELCHILFDELQGRAVDVVLEEEPREGQEKSPREQRAGAFAAELLIPKNGLRALFGDEGRQVATQNKADELVDDVRSFFCTPIEMAVNQL